MGAGNGLPVFFGQVAGHLHGAGWRPVPLLPDTKTPAEVGWTLRNQAPWPDSEIQSVARYYADHACGLAVPVDIFVLDIDVMDEAVSANVEEIAIELFGPTPLKRIGQAPKSLLVYRSDGTTVSAKPHPIEHFSGTGQFAAFGVHGKTRLPYQWPDRSPLDLSADSNEIPVVTGDLQREFMRRTAPLTKPRSARKAVAQGRSSLEPNDPGKRLRDLLRRGLRFRQAARRVLELADVGQRHACVRAIVSTGFNLGHDADTIRQLIKQHASPNTWQAVTQDGYLTRVLRDFQPIYE